MPLNTQALYNIGSKKYNLGSIENFRQVITTDKGARTFYKAFPNISGFKDEDDFVREATGDKGVDLGLPPWVQAGLNETLEGIAYKAATGEAPFKVADDYQPETAELLGQTLVSLFASPSTYLPIGPFKVGGQLALKGAGKAGVKLFTAESIARGAPKLKPLGNIVRQAGAFGAFDTVRETLQQLAEDDLDVGRLVGAPVKGVLSGTLMGAGGEIGKFGGTVVGGELERRIAGGMVKKGLQVPTIGELSGAFIGESIGEYTGFMAPSFIGGVPSKEEAIIALGTVGFAKAIGIAPTLVKYRAAQIKAQDFGEVNAEMRGVREGVEPRTGEIDPDAYYHSPKLKKEFDKKGGYTGDETELIRAEKGSDPVLFVRDPKTKKLKSDVEKVILPEDANIISIYDFQDSYVNKQLIERFGVTETQKFKSSHLEDTGLSHEKWSEIHRFKKSIEENFFSDVPNINKLTKEAFNQGIDVVGLGREFTAVNPKLKRVRVGKEEITFQRKETFPIDKLLSEKNPELAENQNFLDNLVYSVLRGKEKLPDVLKEKPDLIRATLTHLGMNLKDIEPAMQAIMKGERYRTGIDKKGQITLFETGLPEKGMFASPSEIKFTTNEIADYHKGIEPVEPTKTEGKVKTFIKHLAWKGAQSLQTRVELLAGGDSYLYKKLVTDLRAGEAQALTHFYKAQNEFRSIVKEAGLDPKALENSPAQTYNLPSGKTINLNLGELITIGGLLRDTGGKKALHNKYQKGIILKRGTKKTSPVKLSTTDLDYLERAIREDPIANNVLNRLMQFLKGFDKEGNLNPESLQQIVRGMWLEEHGKLSGPWEKNEDYWFRNVEDSARRLNKQVLGRAMFGNSSSLDKKGIFKPRKGFSEAIIIEDAFVSLPKHIELLASYAGKYRPATGARKIITNENFMNQVKRLSPEATNTLLKMREAIDAYEGFRKETSLPTDLFMGLARHSGPAVLGFNIGVIFKQFPSLVLAGRAVGWGNLLRGMKVASDPRNFSKIYDEMVTDPRIRDRFQSTGARRVDITQPRSMTEWYAPETFKEELFNFLKLSGGFNNVLRRFESLGMKGIAFMDTLVHMGIYEGFKVEGAKAGIKPEQLKEYSLPRTLEAMYNTQPSWDATSASSLMLEGRTDITSRIFSMFSSQRHKIVNLGVRSINKYNHSNKTFEDQKALFQDFSAMAFSNAMIAGITMLWTWAQNFGEPDPDTEGKLVDYLKMNVETAMGLVPSGKMVTDFFNQAFDNARGDPNYKVNNPVFGVFENYYKAAYFTMDAVIKSDELFESGVHKGKSKGKIQLQRGVEALVRATSGTTGMPIQSPLNVLRKKLAPWALKPNSYYWRMFETGVKRNDEDMIDYSVGVLQERGTTSKMIRNRWRDTLVKVEREEP